MSVKTELLTKYGGDDQFEIRDGDIALAFRRIRSHGEFVAHRRRADAFVKMMVTGKAVPESLRRFLPIEEETARAAFNLAETSVDGQLSLEDCLEIAEAAGPVFEAISWQWSVYMAGQGRLLETEAIDAAKKESAQTP